MARYHVIVEEEIGGTRVVVVSETSDSYFVAWADPATGDVETSSRMSPSFLARVIGNLGGAKDLIGRVGASLFQRPAR